MKVKDMKVAQLGEKALSSRSSIPDLFGYKQFTIFG
jgi:hypothetical protein